MNGHMRLSQALTLPQYQYLRAFGESRRVTYDLASREAALPDPVREAVGLPAGIDGEFIVHGQEPRYGGYQPARGGDPNKPPHDQPYLWCEWRPGLDGTELVFEPSENDDDYRAGPWLKYIAERILKPWGITVEGRMWYQDAEGAGVILAKDGEVRDLGAVLAYTDPFTQETVFLREEDE